MPIQKGSRAAHERALKAAETRRRKQTNRELDAFIPPGSTGEMADEMHQYRAAPITRKLRNPLAAPRTPRKPPAFPKSYHATPTRHVTRDLKMKEVKKPRPRKLISLRGIRKADTATLEADFEYMRRPRKETGLADSLANEKRYYAIKDELRARANPNLSLYLQRRGIREIGGKGVKKRQVTRAKGTQKRPKRIGRRKSRSKLYRF